MMERHIEASAQTIQTQFVAMTKLVDQRVDANREQSDVRFNAVDARFTAALEALKTLVDERAEISRIHITALQTLLEARMNASDTALVMQAGEYQRRLSLLNHEHARLEKMSKTYVRSDIYAKDNERLYTERRDAIAASERNRVEIDLAASAARRQIVLTALTAGLSGIALVVSVLLRLTDFVAQFPPPPH